MLRRLWGKVEALASGAPESVQACWLRFEDDAESDEYYCPACVEKVADARDATPMHSRNYAPETDGCEICDECGALLDYALTYEGIEYEMDHLEQLDALTTSIWREVLAVVWAASDTEYEERVLDFLRKHGIEETEGKYPHR